MIILQRVWTDGGGAGRIAAERRLGADRRRAGGLGRSGAAVIDSTRGRRPGGTRGWSTLARLRRVIESVPRGKVITYGQVAEAAGFPGAARLTVRALYGGAELPWHRVVAAGGRIALTGEDAREQRLRLSMEGVAFRGSRVRMDLHNWTPRTPRAHRDS